MAATAQDLHVDTADGLRLVATVHVASPPGRTPVLLLHGLSQQRHFWDPVVARLRSRPVAALDQRGHGLSDTPVGADYSLDACAGDVMAALDALGWPRAVLAGHSWGASVALHAGAMAPDRVAGIALVDGGLWSPAALGERAAVRRRLTPPPLGVPAETLWAMVRQGDLGSAWSPELQAALEPTFVADADGSLRTRIGVERHLLVLDGLLDAAPEADLAACEADGTAIWAAVCDPKADPTAAPGGDDPLDGLWRAAKEDAVAAAARRSNLLVHRWSGAVHDVPLQWPSLVAGFIDSLVGHVDGAARRDDAAAPDGGTA